MPLPLASRWIGIAMAMLAGTLPDSPAGAQSPASNQSRPPVRPTRQSVAGIEILSHGMDALRQAPQLTFAPIPTATIGGPDGNAEYDLTWVHTAIVLPDGRVATHAVIGARLSIFDARGRPERHIGRQGQGPGEFIRPSGPVRAGGDTLLVVDAANRRITWFLPDRGIVLERPLAPDFATQLEFVAGTLSDGQIVMTGAGIVQAGEPDRISRPLANVGVVSPADGRSRLIATVPDYQIVMVETRYGGRRRLEPRPLRLGEHAHVAAWGSAIVTATGGPQLEIVGEQGRVIRRIRVPGARRPVTGAMRRVVIDRELARLRGPNRERMVDPAESERLAREVPFADSLPVVGGLVVGTDGRLWVLDAAAPGDESWAATAFLQDGSLAARVEGTGGTPMAFGAGTVLIRREDQDGVVSLTLHRLVARSP